MGHRRLPRRKLGHTDMVVTALGFGGGGSQGSRTTTGETLGAATMLRAWECGINFIDTAPESVDNERRIGLAFSHTTSKPSDLYISTRTTVGAHPSGRTPGAARASVEASLERLGLSSVDMLMVGGREPLDSLMAPGGVLDELESLRATGKFRWLGIGDGDHAKLSRAIQCGRFDAILTFADYNLVRQTAAPLIAEAAAAGVGVIVAQALLFGLLGGLEPRASATTSAYQSSDVSLAYDWWLWARERGISLLALALQYAMRDPRIDSVLAGADSPTQVDEILAAVAEDIDDRVWAEVEDRVGQAHVSSV